MNDRDRTRYWRSLDELTRTPEFEAAVRREFPDDQWDLLPPATRRQFLRVMGASLALAGLTACRWPKEEIVPFAHRPPERTPGVPQQFATAMELAGAATGLLVTSYDGRPIKAEGNPGHPDSLGALSAVGQATVLGLYDPDRSRRLLFREGEQEFVKSWDDFTASMAQHLAGTGKGLAVLSCASSSLSLARVKRAFLAEQPDARWYEFEPISRDAEREGLRAAFSSAVRPIPTIDRASVLACLDADPLFDHPAALRLASEFTAARDPGRSGGICRLWVAEPGYSLTGGRADVRRSMPASRVPATLAAVAVALADDHGVPVAAEVRSAAASLAGPADDFVTGLASDLAAHRGSGLIMVGPRQAAPVHALAAALNRALGNVGRTVRYVAEMDGDRPTHADAIAELADRMRSGSVRTLLILGGNPAYDAPVELGFAELLSELPHSVHLSLYDDETSRRCRWHLPEAHHLEAWGDGRSWDGTVTLQQPLIEPLYGGRSAVELLATLIEPEPVRGYEIVRDTVRPLASDGDFEDFWRRALHDGLISGTVSDTVEPSLDDAAVAEAVAELETPPSPSAEAIELVLTADSRVYDGRFANNGWLQELPDAVTKITWDNALVISPATARGLGVAQNDVVIVAAGERSLEAPVCVVPGIARHVAILSLGYGRTAAGAVGDDVGCDAYRLRTSAAAHVLPGVSVAGTGRQWTLASTQNHWAIDTLGQAERLRRVPILVREASLEAYLQDPEVFHHMDHHPPLKSLWEDAEYEGEQWGMTVDLNACIGCNACVVACQAENNVPLVGREQVINQREMQWIRVDRYFKTPAGTDPDQVDDAGMVFQPMTCVHCENAPCEQVCPVAATQHTRDGLNAMVYNRCIGTRYCANNCPFKVRRFNFFNYHKDLSEVTRLQFNPEVTVRSRGVMEKCTFCVQRIEAVRIAARNDNRPIQDGEIVPACAQSCPSRAIHFGDLNDPDSAVSTLHEEHRSYATLAELNIRPRLRYLARLSSPFGDDGPSHDGGHDDHGKEEG